MQQAMTPQRDKCPRQWQIQSQHLHPSSSNAPKALTKWIGQPCTAPCRAAKLAPCAARAKTPCLVWARSRQAQWLWLEVRVGNTRAMQVYERYGYRRVGERKNYYPADHGQREHAVVMSLKL